MVPGDSNNDGMPDVWETAQGLDPQVADAGGSDLTDKGCSNIGVYINSLFE